MTPAEAEAIGRAWISAGGGWREGMLSLAGIRITVIDATYPIGVIGNLHRARQQMTTTYEADVPDFRDGASKGAALDVVRERWGDPGIFVRPRGSKAHPDWAAFSSTSDLIAAAPTEAAALLAALVAAPTPIKVTP